MTYQFVAPFFTYCDEDWSFRKINIYIEKIKKESYIWNLDINEYSQFQEMCDHKRSFYKYVRKHNLEKELENTECPICLEVFCDHHKVRGL